MAALTSPVAPHSKDTAFRVVSDDYVTDDSGTGIVHSAPAFGEDDYRVCIAHGVISKGGFMPCPVDANGCFSPEVTEFAGMNVKDADPQICTNLKARGRMVQKASVVHSYPFCWRSDTPLIYKAVPSWFVKVESIRDRIVSRNQETYWVPPSVKDKVRPLLRPPRPHRHPRPLTLPPPLAPL